ncbi:MAG TPA: FmdB family zinc ribbon protein [Caldimonas sp.]|jgi:putative FmdB family regulatory protein|nr:FmdB family zinc ribbon protein [Caldimonas sp.]HEX4234148.1 FmdB family zinc ribbon protein [Caldimonas sp.]
MPIYAYRCATCGHAQDVLRKMSDPPLSVCPACGAATFVKQVTAAGFQLKGSGWYVTDFRDGKKPGKPADAGAGADANGSGASDAAAPVNGAKTDAAKAPEAAGTPAASTPSAKKGDAAPAPVAAPAAAPAPAAGKDKA